jgi:Ser/Thr protein kinase RdoA (MazF antagonist)
MPRMADGRVGDSFFGLTPERVLEAVEAAGLACRPVCYPLNSFENRVYEVELADRSRVVAKFYRPGRWSEEQILEEHRFLAELAADEIPVCAVRPFPDGSTLKSLDGLHYTVADRRGGRAPDELDDALARRLGRLIARIHNVGARRAAPSRPSLSADHYARSRVDWLAEHGTIPTAYQKRYFDAALDLADAYETLAEGVPVHRIHADLHLGNLLLRDGLLWVLDFDDFVTGPAVQDLWLAVPGRDRHTLEVLSEAYAELRAFDPAWHRLIEPLRGLRMVRYACWLARRFADPAFQHAWPHFGTEDYWRQETEDLEEQLAYVRGERRYEEDEARRARGEAVVEEAAPELTNRDYFWDWEER